MYVRLKNLLDCSTHKIKKFTKFGFFNNFFLNIIFFQVQFSDFPKGNHGDFLTLATLTTEPPQLCHGAGNSIDASHDQAAIKALEILTELGLDNVKPKKNPDDKKPKPILSNGLKK